MRRPSLLAGFKMAAMLGVSFATASVPAPAGEPSTRPAPAVEAPASGAPSTTPAPAGAPAASGGAAPPPGGPMLGPATPPLELVATTPKGVWNPSSFKPAAAPAMPQ